MCKSLIGEFFKKQFWIIWIGIRTTYTCTCTYTKDRPFVVYIINKSIPDWPIKIGKCLCAE